MPPAATSATPSNKTVLIVEDDMDVREEIELALDRMGYRILTASHGGEALAILRSEPIRPSLILLDWMMPVMDGMSFLGHTASDPRYASIPVVVVSAVARMARIPTLCVAAVVAKPVRLRALVDIVDRICGVPRRGGGGGGGGGDIVDENELDRLIGRASTDPGTPTPHQADASLGFAPKRLAQKRPDRCFSGTW
jgi:CheY-like chemotaxis protein